MCMRGRVWFSVSALVCWCALQHCATNAAGAERFGGVEIGAKGIKVAAVEIGGTKESPTLKVLDLDKKTYNATISRLGKNKKFEDNRIEIVGDVVKDFFELLRDKLHVPEQNIRIAASSGVKLVGNFVTLAETVEKQTKKTLGRVDVQEEGALTVLAIVPPEMRTKVVVFDVGSGSTKGGVFLDQKGNPKDFVSLSLPEIGVQTLAAAIKGRAANGSASTAQVARELVGLPLEEQAKAQKVLLECDKVVVSGGVYWALVTILKPEAALDPFPTVTAGDIRRFAELVAKTNGHMPEVDFNRVTDPNARERAKAEYANLSGKTSKRPTYDPDELRAAADLLTQASLALDFAHRSVHFDRQGVTSWMTAYITPPGYWPLLPAALGHRSELFTAMKMVPADNTDRPAARPKVDVVKAPVGLSESPAELLEQCGFSENAFVYDVNGCDEFAKACLHRGLLKDAVVLLNHALLQDNTRAHLWYLKGFAEIGLNRKSDAEHSADGYKKALPYGDPALSHVAEIFNGPATVSFYGMVNAGPGTE